MIPATDVFRLLKDADHLIPPNAKVKPLMSRLIAAMGEVANRNAELQGDVARQGEYIVDQKSSINSLTAQVEKLRADANAAAAPVADAPGEVMFSDDLHFRRKIEAIKFIRSVSGMGLAEAKTFVERAQPRVWYDITLYPDWKTRKDWGGVAHTGFPGATVREKSGSFKLTLPELTMLGKEVGFDIAARTEDLEKIITLLRLKRA
jgi:hypothetical protein